MTDALLLGCDFSSSPNPRKPIVVATGNATYGISGGYVSLSKIERFTSLEALEAYLVSHSAWLGAFDLPFGLPRELVMSLGWPTDWLPCMRHFCGLTRAQVREAFKAFCDARPMGGKFAHRATDRPAQSSPSMKWVNPPVAYMMHAGIPLLLRTGATLPGLHQGASSTRLALEAYPGLLVRELIGRQSYKSDDKARQTPERRLARQEAVQALEAGRTRLGLALRLSPVQRQALVEDASGDSLDAVACLVQAAWAAGRAGQGDARYGWPVNADPLEGWILSA